MKAITIANYFLSKDKERKIFNNNLVKLNGRKFYEGNARLNKYLFLAQVVYLAKYERLLFEDSFKAYANGPVIEEIMSSYPRLTCKDEINLPKDITTFLDKIYLSLENATYEELIEITHEDPEWSNLKNETFNAPTMNITKHLEEYKKKYKGLIEALKL